MNLSKTNVSDLLKSDLGFEKTFKISGPLKDFDNKFKIKSPVTGLVKLIKIENNEILTDCNLKIILELRCDRCTKNFPKNIELKFNQEYSSKSNDEKPKIENNTINLLQPIKQEMILNLPQKTLCSSDCKGLCYQCGKNLNLEKCDCKPSKNTNTIKDLIK